MGAVEKMSFLVKDHKVKVNIIDSANRSISFQVHDVILSPTTWDYTLLLNDTGIEGSTTSLPAQKLSLSLMYESLDSESSRPIHAEVEFDLDPQNVEVLQGESGGGGGIYVEEISLVLVRMPDGRLILSPKEKIQVQF
ncbi:MAG: hypothetical protein EOP06_04315 [Proteobacteria bacterium]|nr:MAG: hypothetical protein EOP06_04315 [Pseudomonadota bacterium]